MITVERLRHSHSCEGKHPDTGVLPWAVFSLDGDEGFILLCADCARALISQLQTALAALVAEKE